MPVPAKMLLIPSVSILMIPEVVNLLKRSTLPLVSILTRRTKSKKVRAKVASENEMAKTARPGVARRTEPASSSVQSTERTTPIQRPSAGR